MRNENMILRELSHPGVVTLYGSFMDRRNLFLVLDYALNGDLSQMLAKGSLRTHKIRQFYVAQIV